MIFFRHISNVKAEDVLRIREVGGDIVFSIRYPGGAIASISLVEIHGVLDSVHDFEGHVMRSKDELEHFDDYDEEVRNRIYGHRVLTDKCKLELHAQIFEYEDLIKAYNKCWDLFDQLAEAQRAGVANSGIEYVAYLEGQKLGKKDPRPAIARFKKLCEELGLAQKETIPKETLCHIMTTLGLHDGNTAAFTPDSKSYRKGREFASRLGYSQKGSSRYRE